METPNNGNNAAQKEAQRLQQLGLHMVEMFRRMPHGQTLHMEIPRSNIITPGRPNIDVDHLYVFKSPAEIKMKMQL